MPLDDRLLIHHADLNRIDKTDRALLARIDRPLPHLHPQQRPLHDPQRLNHRRPEHFRGVGDRKNKLRNFQHGEGHLMD